MDIMLQHHPTMTTNSNSDLTWRKRGNDKTFHQQQPRKEAPLKSAYAQCTDCNTMYTMHPQSKYERAYRKYCLKSGRNYSIKKHECEICSGKKNRDLHLKQRGYTPPKEKVQEEEVVEWVPLTSTSVKKPSKGVWGSMSEKVKEKTEIKKENKKVMYTLTREVEQEPTFEYCYQCCDCNVRVCWALEDSECYCHCVCE